MVTLELRTSGWRQLIIWECAIRGKDARDIERVINRAAAWLDSRRSLLEIRSR